MQGSHPPLRGEGGLLGPTLGPGLFYGGAPTLQRGCPTLSAMPAPLTEADTSLREAVVSQLGAARGPAPLLEVQHMRAERGVSGTLSVPLGGLQNQCEGELRGETGMTAGEQGRFVTFLLFLQRL